MAGFERRMLGRTGLRVSPIGIGGGGFIRNDDLLYAFERGINYFLFSSDLHHFAYQRSAAALRKLCGRGSAVRDRVVLATVSYVNNPDRLLPVLYDQFKELRVDYVDIFQWGWISEGVDCGELFRATAVLKRPSVVERQLRNLLDIEGEIRERSASIVRQGLARAVGASFHSRTAAAACLKNSFDVFMLRYNVAHRGVEADVFPLLSGHEAVDPGIVVFNAAHAGSTMLASRPVGYPEDWPAPSVPDCYRFALSHSAVDVVLTGVNGRRQVDAALAGVERGPLSAKELEFMRKYGEIHRRQLAEMRAEAEAAAAGDTGLAT